MKKLTIEEKEKAYDEAIKKLRDFYRDYDTVSRLIDVKEELANMFPELKENKESEDERIRKNCIHFLELQKQHHAATFEIEECIDWLEKKDEQKPKGEIEPKFKIGDTIRLKNGDGLEWTVEEVLNNGYYTIVCADRDDFIQLDDNWELVKQKPINKVEPIKVGDIITNGKIIGKVDENENNKYHGWFGYDKNLSVHYADIPDIENWHKWTIQDANDGDVLYENDNNTVLIFKSQTCGWIKVYCDFWISKNKFTGTDHADYGKVSEMELKPATKEQCDLLFQKMKEAGYEWDAEKKGLKKIEQNPAWNEEDEKILSDIIKDLVHPWNEYIPDRIEDEIKWLKNRLKSLKERYTWKPSDEQMDALRYVTNFDYGGYKATLVSLYEQLKKLRGGDV